MRCVFVLLLMLAGGGGAEGPCKSWEFRCDNDRCVSRNRFCDATDDCGDASDEPTGCTNCNQTLMGEVGTKYPLRITEPFQRNLPFVCKLHLVAGGGSVLGERLEITFLSFQIGSLTLDRNGSEDRLECRRGHLRLSESQTDIFLGDDGFQQQGPTLRSQQTRGFSQLISAFKKPPSGPLSKLYDLTLNLEPDFGLFCGSLLPSDLGVAFYSTGNNVTVAVYLPPRSSVGAASMMGSFGLYLTYRFLSSIPRKNPNSEEVEVPSLHLGNPVPDSYCDKAFVNCDRKKCVIRSPNFPGLYLRNFTCNYFLRQDYVPTGKKAHIVVYQANEYKISVNTGSSVVRSDSRKAMNQGSGGLTTDCAGDVVRIYDRIDRERNGGRLLLTEFCESGSLTDVVSSGPQMLVQLFSSPSNLLYESRLELEVRVEFSDANDSSESEFALGRDADCNVVIDGGTTPKGVIRSPRHSVPKNTTCEAKLVGGPSQRVWLYFVSYFVKDHGTLGFDHHPSSTELLGSAAREDTCEISRLELVMSAGRNDTKFGKSKGKSYSFCEATLPVMCTRTADYLDYVPKRPCLPPMESYLSEGNEVNLKYSVFMRDPYVVSSLSATSFLIRYEFVNVDSEEAPTKSPCGRNYSSKSESAGVILSPKNVFFYGRGGRENLSCTYNFQLNSKERVAIEVLDYRSRIQNCSTRLDPLFKRYNCDFRRAGGDQEGALPFRHSFISFSESSGGSSSIHTGCVCGKTTPSSPTFTSSLFDHPSSVTMTFTVSGMSAFEDFEDFGFEVRFRFIPAVTTDKECGVQPETLETHGGEMTLEANPARQPPLFGNHLLRCRWHLQSSSPDKSLYLQLPGGRPCDAQPDDRNRVVLYSGASTAGVMYPKKVLCLPDAPTRQSAGDFENFFSSSWHLNDSGEVQNQSDRVIVELVAFHPGVLSIKWLEVSRPAVTKPVNGEAFSDEGRTLRNVNCLHECPELSACINPELWCDGVVHCPQSGYDESTDNCRESVTIYVSVAAAGLLLFAGVGLAVFLVFRRRRSHQQTHPVGLVGHRSAPLCLQHELASKNFSTSPVFVMGGGTLKKKKKNADDFVRHIHTVEVRFPDIHM